MPRVTRVKGPKTAFMLLTLAGCATVPPQVSSYENSRITPTEAINSYADASRKRELAQVIEETPEQKPRFLKRVDNKKVDFWVNYFAVRDKARFERFLKNGAKYKATIEKIFDDYGLPQELFYVGLIESGYYLGARSHAGAVGPWQFIADTGKRYGLTIRGGIDERRSLIKATEAAALYFQDLYNIFGNWELALSAYNAGEYGVVRRIRKAKTRDYYELSQKKILPKETRHYVPKVLAAMKIMENPAKYGINLPALKGDFYDNTTEVVLKNSVNVDQLAKRLGLKKETILALNPDIYWKNIPHVKGGLKLYLPNRDYKAIHAINTAPRAVAAASASSGGTHKVRRGENLTLIARKLGVSLAELKAANKIGRNGLIRVGQVLNIPDGAVKTEVYRVKRGDNLYTIARRHHTSISKILKLNNLKKRTIYVGQKLVLPKSEKRLYTVRPGDYLLKIAKEHGTTVRKLKELNSVGSKIYPGQKLIVDID